jgi:hypothetical protein
MATMSEVRPRLTRVAGLKLNKRSADSANPGILATKLELRFAIALALD